MYDPFQEIYQNMQVYKHYLAIKNFLIELAWVVTNSLTKQSAPKIFKPSPVSAW